MCCGEVEGVETDRASITKFPSMNSLSRRAPIILANLLILCAIAIFATGFFPHKAFLPGLATWHPEYRPMDSKSPFDKVIFMVVDALRSDFVYGNASNFLFTQSLIRSGAALPFTGHASPPTITMPRVKAITTGSVPSFIDLVLNFAESDTTSTLATQDSWLAQRKAKASGTMVMYGDDTWLRLFPGFFDRSDGTTSFFVSDFTEVDANVTRHIPHELAQSDWSTMVLHFLGLDHIGHKTGPRGPNMPAKQREMDGIVQDIYTAMENSSHLDSCLLVLLGDHGMNEGGNHGGSSAGEVSTALTFISPKLKNVNLGLSSPVFDVGNFRYYDEAEQSDIAPTLAGLLGFPIPKNNLGIIIPHMLSLWEDEADRFQLVLQNALQMHTVAEATFPTEFDTIRDSDACSTIETRTDAQDLACLWSAAEASFKQTILTSMDAKPAIDDLYRFLRKAQDILSGAASNYNLSRMYIGIGIAIAAVSCSILSATAQRLSAALPAFVFVLVMLIYSITMFASSYVEEEHQFWYWALGAWLVTMVCKSNRYQMDTVNYRLLANGLLLISFGTVRRWNQTGQKYAGEADLVTEILTTNVWLLWLLVVLTYALISHNLSSRSASWMEAKRMSLLPILISASAFLFKVAFTWADAPELLQRMGILRPVVTFVVKYPLVSLARVTFLGLVHLLACSIYYEAPWRDRAHRINFLKVFHDVLSLLLVTQTRTVNIPLILLFYVQLGLLRRTCSQKLEQTEVTLTSLLFQYASFFALGGTNAISSVDLSNAYNGVSGYNVVAVGMLTLVSNWAGPIWWTSATCCLLSESKVSGRSKAFDHFALLTLFACVSTLAVMVACTVLREHLFIWTVFSPRYLYTVAWAFGQHVMINGVFGSILLVGI